METPFEDIDLLSDFKFKFKFKVHVIALDEIDVMYRTYNTRQMLGASWGEPERVAT